MGNGIRLALMVFVGFILVEIGLTGKLGSILGAFLLPEYMQDNSGGGNLTAGLTFGGQQ